MQKNTLASNQFAHCGGSEICEMFATVFQKISAGYLQDLNLRGITHRISSAAP